jgi:hypothetical protein
LESVKCDWSVRQTVGHIKVKSGRSEKEKHVDNNYNEIYKISRHHRFYKETAACFDETLNYG